MPTHHTALVLAAGLSTRMGAENKLLLPWGDQALIHYVVQEVVQATQGEVLVVLGHQAHQVQGALKEVGDRVRFVLNPDYASGMTSSIQAGIAQSHPDSQGYMIALGDMPLLTAAHYQTLWEAFATANQKDELGILQPHFEEAPGNPVIFSARHRKALLAHAEPEGCRGLLKQFAKHVVRMPLPQLILQDADTPEQWQAMQRLDNLH